MENIIYAQGEDGRFFRTDVDIETSREHANFANVQYVEIIEVTYRKVDG